MSFNAIGQPFTVSRFSPQGLSSRLEAYQRAAELDGSKQDGNPTPDQIQFQEGNRTLQIIMTPNSAMARVIADGKVQAVEQLSDKVEVAAHTNQGCVAQVAAEIPGSGDGWYTARDFGVSESPHPEQTFATLNHAFEAQWKLA